MTEHDTPALLDVDGLCVDFRSGAGWLRVVDDVGFRVAPGEVVGLVGESGSGKSVSSLAIMRLLPPRSSRITARTLTFEGRDITALSSAEMRSVRGAEIAMIFQEPMTSLNPAFTVGNQIAEAVRVHRGGSRKAAYERATEMLDRVGIPDPHRRVRDYPHAFSGGMRQRAMIAMALACDPKLLIADEPTTALDVTIQAQILELVKELQSENGMSVVFVTHDLGVVADICDRVVVMYSGEIVEEARVEPIFATPQHPYTEGLLESMPQVAKFGEALTVIPGQVPHPDETMPGCRFEPRCRHAAPACSEQPVALRASATGTSRCARTDELALVGTRWQTSSVGDTDARGVRQVRTIAVDDHSVAPPLLAVSELTKSFPVRSGFLRRVIGQVEAVSDVGLTIRKGETLGLVGESGSGKSTVARLILRLIEPTSGSVRLNGVDVASLPPNELRAARRNMQIVFQDPYSSLDPRCTIADSIGEPLQVHLGLAKPERKVRVEELLSQVGLGSHAMRRFPHEFSGGQRQRIAIARALALEPDLVICDEPVSSLDVSTQSQVINLLTELRDRLGLAYLFIAHDLSVVRHLSDRIAVMYLGRIVEDGPGEEVYTHARHPYTEALLSAIPVPNPMMQRERSRIVLRGDIPSPLRPPSGCRFRTRCPYAMEICAVEDPKPFRAVAGVSVSCHLHTSGPTLAGAPIAELMANAVD